MLTLNFKLHEFQRLSWLGQGIQAHWNDKLKQLAEQIKLKFPILYQQIYPVVLHRIYPHELEKLEYDCYKSGKGLHVIELDDGYLGKFYLEFKHDDRKIAVLSGAKSDIQNAMEAMHKHDVEAYHTALGTPVCCSRFLAKLKDEGIEESIWGMTQDGKFLGERHVKVSGHYATNRFLEPLGIYLLKHRACCSRCRSTLVMAERLIKLAVDNGEKQLTNEIKSILSWHYSWSTLHGIAELKTPLFKMIYNSQACAQKYQVDWHGEVQYDTGIYGIGFPYNKPRRVMLTESLGYKRGLENNIE